MYNGVYDSQSRLCSVHAVLETFENAIIDIKGQGSSAFLTDSFLLTDNIIVIIIVTYCYYYYYYYYLILMWLVYVCCNARHVHAYT